MVQRLEELTLNTSPAIYQSLYDGWMLRASGTDTRRANSVTALQASQLPVDEKIHYCEAWYRAHGQPAMFRINDLLSPATLDTLLSARGYTREMETLVMTTGLDRELPALARALATDTKISERSEVDGIGDAHRLKHLDDTNRERDLARQAMWKGKQLFVSLKTNNGLAATGMARIEDGYIGIFNMRTAVRARSKGYATHLLTYLLTWGQAEGAGTAFLQVDAANVAAISIYRKFGFETAYQYWHRVAPKDAVKQK